MRDNFTRQTAAELAKGVAYRCSNPDCCQITVASNANQDGVVIIGVAAHIHAASPGGPRFDPAQSTSERRAKENGIWLCQNCARLVDVDPAKYTAEKLLHWKREAQRRAFRELTSGAKSAIYEPAPSPPSDTFAKVHGAAKLDLEAFKRTPIWSETSVELFLRPDDKEAQPFQISRMPKGLEIAPEIALISPPGTGKTTTLLQLATHAIDKNDIVPLYLRLGEWSAQPKSLIASVLEERGAFSEITRADLNEIAGHGQLLLLLDGWNEIDLEARRRIKSELDRLRREWPSIKIVATTRRQALDVPLQGPRITVEALNESQQMAIAEAMHGDLGKAAVDTAWRTRGLRELIAIPLYLKALVSVSAQGSSPDTKEAVLRLFVNEHEKADDHAEALDRILHRRHRDFLTALASALNSAGKTAMSEDEANAVVASTTIELRTKGLVDGPFEPARVLDTLVSHHALVRSGGIIEFHHQQIQEWFASDAVEDLIRHSAAGDLRARDRLVRSILNLPAWEESILFAIERIARLTGGAELAAHAIELALAVDPMLCAEMIYRSSANTWALVKARTLEFAARWHKPGQVDRAVRFMVLTGKQDFAPLVWPLASSKDSRIQLPTLRTRPRFRPSVLGADAKNKIATLPEEERGRLLGLIASESGVDGMEFATAMAKEDQSAIVQAEVVRYLSFRRADRHVAAILENAQEETWSLVAAVHLVEELGNEAFRGRLEEERRKALSGATDIPGRIRCLVEMADDPSRTEKIAALIADPAFPIRDENAPHLFHLLMERAKVALGEGILRRIAVGLDLPVAGEDMLASMEVVEDGRVAEKILVVGKPRPGTDYLGILAGPKVAGQLIDRFVDASKRLSAARNDTAAHDEYQGLLGRLGSTRAPVFLEAVKERLGTTDIEVIAALAGLLSHHGNRKGPQSSLPIGPSDRDAFEKALRRWVGEAVRSDKIGRHELAQVASAIGRTGIRTLLPELRTLLDEDQRRLAKAREEFSRTRIGRDISGYGMLYRSAFIMMGGDDVATAVSSYLESPEFGSEAAYVLKALADKASGQSNRNPSPLQPYEEVAAARAARLVGKSIDDRYSRPVFDAVKRLISAGDDKSYKLAIELARIGLSIPHNDQDALVDQVIALPVPIQGKRSFLTAVVLDGRIIEAAPIVQTIDAWIADASRDEQTAWLKRQHTWEIAPWLELLSYSTDPVALFESLEKVKAFYSNRWRQRWEGVLHAVTYIPGDVGEDLLENLARKHRNIEDDYSWMNAFFRRGTLSSVLRFVDLYVEGIFGGNRTNIDGWHIARELAKHVERFPTLDREMRNRYAASNGQAQSMIEQYFGERGNDQDLLSMLSRYASAGRSYDRLLHRVVESAGVTHDAADKTGVSYLMQPAALNALRKELFRILNESGPSSVLAENCLTTLDELRDQNRIAPDDVRHPDVNAGLSWPKEAGPPDLQVEAPQSPSGELAVEDIAQFTKMKEVVIQSSDGWMQAMSTLPERKVNEAFAELFDQPAKKDWSGEPNDLFTPNLLFEGRRRSAAFLLKGPSQFREMTLEMCGKRADQIHRLAKSGADILVVQHSHQIGEAVRDTLRAMAGDRPYCFIDGQATYRILKAYGYI